MIFFFVTGQIYTDKVAPENLKGQAQGMLVLFTLGLGMTIGAQIAGKVEAAYTPAIVAEINESSKTATEKIATLEKAKEGAGEAQLAILGTQIAKLNEQKQKNSIQILREMNWKMIWGIPAIMAALVLAFFMVAFKHKDQEGAELSHGPVETEEAETV